MSTSKEVAQAISNLKAYVLYKCAIKNKIRTSFRECKELTFRIKDLKRRFLYLRETSYLRRLINLNRIMDFFRKKNV